MLFVSCGNLSSKVQTTDTDNTAVIQANVVSGDHDTQENNISQDTEKSLNEIRFGNWTEKDWQDNGYYQFLRQTFNDYLNGYLKTELLAPYKSLLQSKFVVGSAEEFRFGGMLVYIMFLEAPDDIFRTTIYSYVDKNTRKVIGYELRTFTLTEEKSNLTQKDILEFNKEHPEHKIW